MERVAAIGPNAHDPLVLLGNYHGTPSSSVTPLEGIQTQAAQRTDRVCKGLRSDRRDDEGFERALDLANDADVIIFVGGISQQIEGEEGQDEGVPRASKPGRPDAARSAVGAGTAAKGAVQNRQAGGAGFY